MGMDIMGLGGSYRQQALAGMDKAARMGLERENAETQLKAQRKQTKSSMAGSGMAAGAMIGMALGPVGALVGGVLGGAAGFFGADLF